jgi:hypothetical protein
MRSSVFRQKRRVPCTPRLPGAIANVSRATKRFQSRWQYRSKETTVSMIKTASEPDDTTTPASKRPISPEGQARKLAAALAEIYIPRLTKVAKAAQPQPRQAHAPPRCPSYRATTCGLVHVQPDPTDRESA